MKCQGQYNIDITCGKCDRKIVVLVDEERVMVLENRREETWRDQCLFEIEKNERVNELIAITKSNSGISGPELAKAYGIWESAGRRFYVIGTLLTVIQRLQLGDSYGREF